MKRKKYVKQLMALGMTRNQANAMAYCCRVAGRTYEADYKKREPWLRISHEAHKVAVSLRVSAGYWRSGLARAAAKAAKLARSLQDSVTTVQPFRCREESNGGDCAVEINGRHFIDGNKIVFSTVDEVHTWDPAEALKPIREEAQP